MIRVHSVAILTIYTSNVVFSISIGLSKKKTVNIIGFSAKLDRLKEEAKNQKLGHVCEPNNRM